MTPVILTDPDDSGQSWLVDEDSEMKFPYGEDNKILAHYLSSVRLVDLRPGQFGFNISMNGSEMGELNIKSDKLADFSVGMIFPYPEVYAIINTHKPQGFEKILYSTRAKTPLGIHRPAAVVMLQLAESYSNLTISPSTNKIQFNNPRMEGSKITWDKWKFYTAWMWSDWTQREISTKKKVTQNDRWREMVKTGYPYGEKAFGNMHRALFPKPTG